MRRLVGLISVFLLIVGGCGGDAADGPVASRATSSSSSALVEASTTSATTTMETSTIASPATISTSSPAGPLTVVVDHTTTDPKAIPDRWLAAAQETVVWAYGSTSHGTQLWVGAADLADHVTRLGFAAEWRAVPEGDGLAMAYDDGWAWDPATFADEVRALLAEAPAATAFMWSWCGELSDEDTDLDAYLDAMMLLRAEYPDVTFVAMTGHTDGGSPELTAANDRIRQWVRATGGVLFDFADIESFDPAGREYPDTDDSCPWCEPWCATNPENCAGLDDVDCAHSHPLICRLKAGALWWLSARLAGWEGDVDPAP